MDKRWLAAGCAALVALAAGSTALVVLIASLPPFFRLLAIGGGLLIAVGAWLVARAHGAGLREIRGALSAPPAETNGEVAGQITAAEARLEAGRQRIAQLDAEIARHEAEIRAQEEAAGLDPTGWVLRDHFAEYQAELARQGYRVVNPGYVAALPVREAIDSAVRCRELAELGARDLEAFLRRQYGAEADRFIVDSVRVDVVRDRSWSGKVRGFLDVVAPRNHVATRVITPDGRRFVLDYWEASRGSGAHLVSEEQWVARWRPRLGDDTRFCGSDENASDEDVLVKRVAFHEKRGASREQALDAYRQVEEEKIRNAPGDDATRERRLKQLGTRIRTFRRCGGFRSPAP